MASTSITLPKTGGAGGGAVSSVNGLSGAVTLSAANIGADPAGTAQTLFDSLGDKHVRSTRFAIIGSGTSGSVALPANSTVVLDDFGGTTDAIICAIDSGRPLFTSVKTTSGVTVATSFDSFGNYNLSGAPTSYPIGIIYRVKQALKDFDSDSSDIVGSVDFVAPSNSSSEIVNALIFG